MAESQVIERGIAEEIAQVHGHWYGSGPASARAHYTDDLLVVVLEETFTLAERELIRRQQTEGIREIRRRFQEMMAEDFISIVTQHTGRQVRAFLSDTDLKSGIAVETFVLGATLQNMAEFED